MKRLRDRGLVLAIALLMGIISFCMPQSEAWADQVADFDRGPNVGQPIPLTVEILTDRLQVPVQREGARVIDLRRLIIDLRPEADPAIRDSFYRLLREQMRQSSTPIGLDLSYATVRGTLDFSRLGDRVPLYSQALPPIFSDVEQEQLQRDRRRLVQLSQLSRSLLLQTSVQPLQIYLFRGPLKLVQTTFEGTVSFSNTFFQGGVDAEGATFTQALEMIEARFGRRVDFSGAVFQQEVRCRNTIFFDRTIWNQAQFQGTTTFQGSEFREAANFSQTLFQKPAFLIEVNWRGSADFDQSRWQDSVLFNKSKFSQSLFLTKAIFERRVRFREVQFNQPVNLRSASIREQADFGDVTFSNGAYLNVSGLEFNADEAKILGDPGQIGQVFSVPTLQGNETLLRNLVRNFRLLEQISDANQVEYTTEKLRLRQLGQRLSAMNLNTASIERLRRVGFTQNQAEAIAHRREEQYFQRVSDLLKLDEIDLTTYVKVNRDLVAIAPRTLARWLLDALHWLGLSLLLLLTRYGTSFWLIVSTGLLLTTYFSVLFWLIDRLRKLRPCPIVPTAFETSLMVGTAGFFGLISLILVFRVSDQPWLTLACLAVLSVPIPGGLVGVLYKRGRYHDLMDSSYLVEDGGARQLRLLIGRLPVIPKFPFFRDRFTPILWDRRWNWLNYFDFSLINLIKFGFNDIRLRDQHMPGLITGLVWYQWALGLLYIALLLWTLSRTIPGLNLLIYFK